MSEKNFMEAGTEIESYISTMEQCVVKVSNVLGEACVSRAKNGKSTSNIENDITNIIKNLPPEYQIKILTRLASILTSQIKGGKTESSKKETRRRNDIFSFRDNY